MPDLFTPFELGSLRLPNRVVMAPMTRHRAVRLKVPTEMMAVHYAQRASAGLLIAEATHISHLGSSSLNAPGLFTDEHEEAWRRVTGAVREADGRIYLQLSHVGRMALREVLPEGAVPVAPSAIAAEMTRKNPAGELVPFPVPRALQLDEIPGIVEEFRAAAERALAADFDGVEIHGAHGFLIDQFLRDRTNHRTDDYGGAPENRARFLAEVAEAVVGVWGPKRVGLRLSPRKTFNDSADSNPRATFAAAIDAVAGRDLAYLHLTEEPPGGAAAAPGTEGIHEMLRASFPGPVILNGGYDRARADADIASGAADLIAFGTDYMANPDLVERLRAGAPFNELDKTTIYRGGEKGYNDYPTLAETVPAG